MHDQSLNEWTPFGNLYTARYFHATSLLNGELWMTGGSGSKNRDVKLKLPRFFIPNTLFWFMCIYFQLKSIHNCNAGFLLDKLSLFFSLFSSYLFDISSKVMTILSSKDCTNIVGTGFRNYSIFTSHIKAVKVILKNSDIRLSRNS